MNIIQWLMSKLAREEGVIEDIRADFQGAVQEGDYFKAKQCVAAMEEWDSREARLMRWDLQMIMKKDV